MQTKEIKEFLGFVQESEFDTGAISIASSNAISSWSKAK
jgi:hypothetical protein